MAQTYTKNYNIDTFSELISDLQTAYEWHEVQISEDNLTATFFVTESIPQHLIKSSNIFTFLNFVLVNIHINLLLPHDIQKVLLLIHH